MLKKYILSQLTSLSAWAGSAVVVSSFILPDSVTIILGIVLVITPDEKLNQWIRGWSPTVRKILEG